MHGQNTRLLYIWHSAGVFCFQLCWQKYNYMFFPGGRLQNYWGRGAESRGCSAGNARIFSERSACLVACMFGCMDTPLAPARRHPRLSLKTLFSSLDHLLKCCLFPCLAPSASFVLPKKYILKIIINELLVFTTAQLFEKDASRWKLADASRCAARPGPRARLFHSAPPALSARALAAPSARMRTLAALPPCSPLCRRARRSEAALPPYRLRLRDAGTLDIARAYVKEGRHLKLTDFDAHLEDISKCVPSGLVRFPSVRPSVRLSAARPSSVRRPGSARTAGSCGRLRAGLPPEGILRPGLLPGGILRPGLPPAGILRLGGAFFGLLALNKVPRRAVL